MFETIGSCSLCGGAVNRYVGARLDDSLSRARCTNCLAVETIKSRPVIAMEHPYEVKLTAEEIDRQIAGLKEVAARWRLDNHEVFLHHSVKTEVEANDALVQAHARGIARAELNRQWRYKPEECQKREAENPTQRKHAFDTIYDAPSNLSLEDLPYTRNRLADNYPGY